jgi:hypothetical protein
MANGIGKTAGKILQGVITASIIGGFAMMNGHAKDIVRHDVKLEQCSKETADLKTDLKELITRVDAKVDKLGEKLDIMIMHQMQQTLNKDPPR